MKSLKLKFVAFFEFVRRERIYFLALILCLALTALSQDYSSEFESSATPALDLLQQQSAAWSQKLQDQGVWARVISEHPWTVMAWGGTMLVFFLLFLSGCFTGLARLFSATVRGYFGCVESERVEPDLPPVLFFRVCVLIYLIWATLAWCSGFFYFLNGINENGLGIFQALLLDGLVCFSVYAVLREAGITWGKFMGPSPSSRFKEVFRGVIEYVSIFPWFLLSVFALMAFSAFFHYEPPPHPLVEIFLEEERGSQIVFWTAIALASVIAPILEEIFFRGFCYRFLKQLGGVRFGLLCSSSLFAALHGTWFAFLPIFVLGMGLARLYEKRGSFTACWTFHVLHNILFTVYFFSSKTMLEAFHA